MKDQIFYCQNCGYKVEAEEGYRFENPNAAAAWAAQVQREHGECKTQTSNQNSDRRWHRAKKQ